MGQKMEVYLTMLYVNLEQETAVKNLFLSHGWAYNKPDLDIVTDQVGPPKKFQSDHEGVNTSKTETTPVRATSKRKAGSKRKSRANFVTEQLKRTGEEGDIDGKGDAGKVENDLEKGEIRLNEVNDDADVIEATPDDIDESDIDDPDKDDDFASEAENEFGSEAENDFDEQAIEFKVEQNEDFEEEDDGVEEIDIKEKDNSGEKSTPMKASTSESASTSKASKGSKRKSWSTSADTAAKIKKFSADINDGETKDEGGAAADQVDGDVEVLLKRAEILTRQTLTLSDSQTVFCPCCEKICHRHRLKRHILSHIEFPYKCLSCKVYFKDKSEEEEHHKKKHQPNYQCNLCDKSYVNRTGLRTHQEQKHPELEVKKFICTVCDKGFPTNTRLKIHMAVHSEDKPFTCDQCGAGFKRRLALKNHTIYIHDGVPRKEYRKKCHTCEYCGDDFTTHSSLKEHILIKHTENPGFKHKCDICGLSFLRAVRLESHVNRDHLNIKPYFCNVCGKAYYTDVDCNRHKRLYHNEENKDDNEKNDDDFENVIVKVEPEETDDIETGKLYGSTEQTDGLETGELYGSTEQTDCIEIGDLYGSTEETDGNETGELYGSTEQTDGIETGELYGAMMQTQNDAL